jgi:hypothetical protein
MKDLDYMSNNLSGKDYRVSPEGASLMDETNSLAEQIEQSPLSTAVIMYVHEQDS